MKTTMFALSLVAFFATSFFFPTKALAVPPHGLRIIYYSNSTYTVEVGRRYYCVGWWLNYGRTSSYKLDETDPTFCQGEAYYSWQY